MPPKAHYPIFKLSDFDGFDGMLICDIAKEMKRSYETVRGAIHRLGIRDRFPPHGIVATRIAVNGYI